MTMQNIFKRAANWNKQRYPQIYSSALTFALLEEEYQELTDAHKNVDKLDALCDIIYVSMGALWKLKAEHATLDRQSTFVSSINSIKRPDLGTILLLKTIINECENEMVDEFNFSNENVIEALNIVCDANDSKTAKMTHPGIKANINKGDGFVAPEARLQNLLNRVKL
jgi:hypothetical protein